MGVMRRIRQQALLAVVVIATVSPVHAQVAASQFEQWFEQVSNRGRWGADDELGTLNFITPELTRKALQSVRDGVSISLSRELKPGDDPNALAPLHVDYTGEGGSGLVSFFGDRTEMVYHGWAYSHLDALAHVASHGSFYNGFDASLVGS